MLKIHIKNRGKEYITKSGKIYNATKVVKCSKNAGVGRTDTFAASLDYLYGPRNKTPIEIVKELSEHRTHIVQASD